MLKIVHPNKKRVKCLRQIIVYKLHIFIFPLQTEKMLFKINKLLNQNLIKSLYGGLAVRYSSIQQHHEKIENMVGKNLLTLKEFETHDIENLLWCALDMKKTIKESNKHNMNHVLEGKSVTAIFQKKSTRTRISFEAGSHHLGAHLIFCNKEDIHLGESESVRDTATVMSHLCNAITARVYEHSLLEELANFSKVPIINALSDMHHPMQALADLMVIYEHYGHLKDLKIAWVGDGNNVLHSLMIAACKMKMNIAAAYPKGYEPNHEVLEYAKMLAKANNTLLVTTSNPEEAVRNADIIVTDTWVSMGQESEKKKRLASFKGYQVNMELLKHAKKNWTFLHCLPRKQEEVDDHVFYHKQSLVFQEAENRKWTTMSVLANLMAGYTPKLIKIKPKF